MTASPSKFLAYIGTYTSRGAEGIYTCAFDPATGALTNVDVTAGIKNPTFLALDPQQQCLYAVSEVGEVDGQPSGAAVAFTIEPQTGKLSLLNHALTGGKGPCHVCVDQTGQAVLAANYQSGSACVLPRREDGRLGTATEVVQHQGTGANPRRQSGPHAHSVTLSPDNRYAFVCDLGIDKIMIYQLDPARGTLTPNDPPWAETHGGAGPRHFAFHPTGDYAYVIDELDSTMIVFAYDKTQGTLEHVQTIPTLPEGFEGTSWCADVHVGPAGRFLYGSNRGHDSIVSYEIDPATGKLSLVGYEHTGGKTPRNFALDPTGSFLLAANQDTNNIVTFRLDEDTGTLTPTGHVLQVPAPVCIQFATFA